MIDPIHSYHIERSLWLEWDQVVQTGNKFYFGHGSWIDLHWRVATDDVKRTIAKMARTSPMSCPHCDGITPRGELLHSPGCPNEAGEEQ